MQIKKNVMATNGGLPFVVDLADFPHGELASVRKDSQYDIEFYNVPEGTQVVSYNEQTGLPEFHDVKFWSVHRGKPIEIVNLDDGRQIITDNDPRAVYGIATKGGSLTPARFTPTEAMDKGVMVPVSESPAASDAHGMSYDFSDGLIKDVPSATSVPLDFAFGQAVGLMAGDGWVDSIGIVSLSDNEGLNAKALLGFLRSGPYPEAYMTDDVFSPDMHGRYGRSVRYRVNTGSKTLGVRIKELIDGHGDESTSGSANKRLPVWYQFAGKDFILGLVNGLIATDGTVCVSNGKSKPQLQISFTSTSLRLVREFKRCCQLVGVKSAISFSKNTSGGNTAWICNVSTVDAKSVGLLSRCCHDRKRDVFDSATVSDAPEHSRNNVVPLPSGVAARLVKLVPAAKVSGVDLDALGEKEKARRLRYQATAINLRAHAGKGAVTRFLVRRIAEIGKEIADNNMAAFERGRSVMENVSGRFSGLLENDNGGNRRTWKVEASVDEADAFAAMIASVKPSECSSWQVDVRSISTSLSIVRRKGFVTWDQLSNLKAFFDKYPTPNSELRDSDDLSALVALAESNVSWVGIKSVEKTGKVEIGYDLTVPGPDTFMSDDGIVLSNTVNIHVPASEKAAKQALDKMLPSKNLYSLTDMQAMRYKPEKEQISGLWALTRGSTRKPVRHFGSKSEAIAAYRNGEIGPNDPVEIKA